MCVFIKGGGGGHRHVVCVLGRGGGEGHRHAVCVFSLRGRGRT